MSPPTAPTGECPAPTSDYEPACWRAGEIIRGRCVAAGETEQACEARAVETRRRAANLGVAYHLLIPGAEPIDWLDSGQCRDCFVPAFSHRPRTSVQYGLAITNFDNPTNPRRFRWGFIGSSDNHRARPGTGYKAYDRLRQTEAAGANSDEWRTRILGPRPQQSDRPSDITQEELLTRAGFQLDRGGAAGELLHHWRAGGGAFGGQIARANLRCAATARSLRNQRAAHHVVV